ncbi:lytic polysaccharide monooxygenase [Pseudomonas sp. FEN]|uniref:lytic polysaccharide monooxygenase n=1 Tax=Pseudomonas sp. FEN TaxID=2767468 RepID=UPI00174C9C98|nr:lytic polysaccharide monooxygenase [Pseudomonas sp. FEN]
MNSLHFYARSIIRCALAALLALPALGWAHGAVDIPVTRQTLCRSYNDYNGPPDKMKDDGCRRAVTEPGHARELIKGGEQWNEVTAFINGRWSEADGGEAALKEIVPDGKLCSANRKEMDVLNLAMPEWTKTLVTPDSNGKLRMRLIMTAAHEPGFITVYLSKPGYDSAARPLEWKDLELIYSEHDATARNDWGTQPPLISAVKFFQFDVPIPAGRSGNAVLFTRWQRKDPRGEGFYGCSDITFGGVTQPQPWTREKVFIDADVVHPEPGDKVHYRVFGHDRAGTEVVDLKLPIDASNQAPAVWGKQLADQLTSYQNIVRIGTQRGDEIVFNASNIYANHNYLKDNRNSTQMSVDSGNGGENPEPVVDARPPVAVIDGPTDVKAGERFTLKAGRSTTYNNLPLRYTWAILGGQGWSHGDITAENLTITAPTGDQAATARVLLTVRDDVNEKRNDTEVSVTTRPESGGGNHEPYQEGKNYQAGDIVTNAGANYQCKPWPYTPWCAGAAGFYAPGTGIHWQEAWDKVQ